MQWFSRKVANTQTERQTYRKNYFDHFGDLDLDLTPFVQKQN